MSHAATATPDEPRRDPQGHRRASCRSSPTRASAASGSRAWRSASLAFAFLLLHEPAARVGRVRDQHALLARHRPGRGRARRARSGSRTAAGAGRSCASPSRCRPTCRSASRTMVVLLVAGIWTYLPWTHARRAAAGAVPERAVPVRPHAASASGCSGGSSRKLVRDVAAHRRAPAQGPRRARAARPRTRSCRASWRGDEAEVDVRSATSVATLVAADRACSTRSCSR